MPLNPNILNSAASLRSNRNAHAIGGALTRSVIASEQLAEQTEIDRINDIGKAVADTAIEKGLPFNLLVYNSVFSGSRGKSRFPILREKTKVPDIDDNGFAKKDPKTGKIIYIKTLAVKRGEIDRQIDDGGWMLNLYNHPSSRNVGAFLSIEGRLGFYDIGGKLERFNPHSTHAEEPYGLDRSSTSYAKNADGSENGIFYLDKATHDLPKFVEKGFHVNDSDGRPYTGLAAVEYCLMDFVVQNNLDH